MSSKGISQAEDLRADLARRFATVSAVNFDVNRQPYFLVGSGAAGSQSVTVKVQDYSLPGLNAFGNPQEGYGNPVVLQICEEAGAVAGDVILTAVNQLAVMSCVAFRGARVELYVVANGTAPLLAGIIPANKVATWDPDMKWKLMSSM